MIRLEKRPGSRLGVDVGFDADGAVVIVEAVYAGLVEDWNKTHPEKAVTKGDKIIAVNGANGNAEEMLQVCKMAAVLDMLVQRPEPTQAQAAVAAPPGRETAAASPPKAASAASPFATAASAASMASVPASSAAPAAQAESNTASLANGGGRRRPVPQELAGVDTPHAQALPTATSPTSPEPLPELSPPAPRAIAEANAHRARAATAPPTASGPNEGAADIAGADVDVGAARPGAASGAGGAAGGASNTAAGGARNLASNAGRAGGSSGNASLVSGTGGTGRASASRHAAAGGQASSLAVSLSTAQEYEVEISRPPNSSMGVDFELLADGLLVDEITGGLLGQWNARHPELRVSGGDKCVEVNGIRGAGRQLVDEIKKSRTLSMKFVRERLQATSSSTSSLGLVSSSHGGLGEKQQLADLVLMDVEHAEEVVYGGAFAEFASGADDVSIDTAALKSLVTQSTSIREEDLAIELLKAAPDLRLSLPGMLALIRECAAPDEPALARFMEVAAGNDTADADKCRAGLPKLMQEVLGQRPRETQAWLERVATSAMHEAAPAPGVRLDVERWMQSYKRAARIGRLFRYMDL